MKRKVRNYFLLNAKYDFIASITVFFVALPLCLGISLASGAPVYSGLLAGIIGGIIVSLISQSQLSVSGPAAGLTAICAAAIIQLGSLEYFFAAIALAGLMQILLGVFRLGGFTQFIPSAVIRGMLAAIGIILMSKQIPLLIGYNQPDFWTKEFFNLYTFQHGFKNIGSLFENISPGVILISVIILVLFYVWEKFISKGVPYLPSSFIVVLEGVVLAFLLSRLFPSLQLASTHYVTVPENIFSNIHLPVLSPFISKKEVWQNAIVICFVATLETLLSVAAIDKLDPSNRITPQNRELVAQGTGNFISGLLGGLPITAVIVRSSANAEAGARTKLSAFMHGVWLAIAVMIAVPVLNLIPYCALAVILIRTGYNLAKPKMILSVYKQGREQFFPFAVTVVAILFTDLLIGVLIGIAFAVYYIIVHTYRAGYTIREYETDGKKYFFIELALNVSFLNKKRIIEMLDKLPEDSIVEIVGSKSVYIDHDILEIFQDFKAKAKDKDIQLTMKDIAAVETMELH
ncbi:MAG: SulP family inorganic anion transporter [Bacteroidetes bacterium]|nr:SulP family inorganic anion transporter [Bacteroidota bacterium]